MKNIENLIRPDLFTFKPYSSAYDETETASIRLNANELPWQAELFDNVVDNVVLNRYPKKQPPVLQQKLAELYGVDVKQLALLRGSDDGIDLLVRLFCQAGKDAILTCPPTFGFYSVCAQLQG